MADSAWYHDYVAAAYAYGLIQGKAADSFAPDDDMSLAEVIALAKRAEIGRNYVILYSSIIPMQSKNITGQRRTA